MHDQHGHESHGRDAHGVVHAPPAGAESAYRLAYEAAQPDAGRTVVLARPGSARDRMAVYPGIPDWGLGTE
jgi:hypothetical protein